MKISTFICNTLFEKGEKNMKLFLQLKKSIESIYALTIQLNYWINPFSLRAAFQASFISAISSAVNA